MDVMRSVLGMVVLLTIAFLLSVNKKKISLRTVGAALVLQVVIGGIMLWLPPGRWVAEKVAFGVHKVMAYSDALMEAFVSQVIAEQPAGQALAIAALQTLGGDFSR